MVTRRPSRPDSDPQPDGPAMLRKVLEQSAPRPERKASQAEKNQYAVRFADRMAELLARDLSPRMQGIEASTKRGASSVRGK